MSDKPQTLTGLRMTGYRRLNNSVNGNPRYDVAFSDGDANGMGYIFTTQSDVSANYDVTNIMSETDRNPDLRVTVTLTRAGRVRTITRET